MSSSLPRRWAGALAGIVLVGVMSIPAFAADAEHGTRLSSQCSVGTETRPAVTWRAAGTINVRPPGYSSPLPYASSFYISGTNGGLMSGGTWTVSASVDVDQAKTYGSCTTP